MFQTIRGHETHQHGGNHYGTHSDMKQSVDAGMNNNKGKTENCSSLLSPGECFCSICGAPQGLI